MRPRSGNTARCARSCAKSCQHQGTRRQTFRFRVPAITLLTHLVQPGHRYRSAEFADPRSLSYRRRYHRPDQGTRNNAAPQSSDVHASSGSGVSRSSIADAPLDLKIFGAENIEFQPSQGSCLFRSGEGRERAKVRGVRLGRKPKLTPHQCREALARREAGEVLTEIARTFDVSHSTISRLRSRCIPTS